MIDLSGKPIYRFEDVEIDASRCLLKRGGREQHLRQQTFQVLLYLLERRQRLVTKEELIENVWHGIAVTDNALVQCIGDIRRTLGDDSRHPRFVRTFPKIGYHFIAAVEEVSANGSPLIESEEVTKVGVQIENQLSEQPKRRTGLIASTGVITKRLTILATLLLAIVAGGLYSYRAQRSWRSNQRFGDITVPNLPGKRPLVVLDFDNRSRSKDLDWMRAGLPDMLITNLSRSNKLTVLSRQQVYMLLTRLERQADADIRLDEALEIARRSKADVIVLGSFATLEGRVRVEAQLHDAHNGQLLAAEHFIAERPNQILTQIDLLSLKLASHLGAAPAEHQIEAGLADVMTDSLEAYRYYSMALEKAQALENREAIELLERAVVLDPEFAMAHARIGYVYALSWGFADKAKPHLEKAFQLSNRLTEKDKLYITAWYATANLDYAGATKVFREIVAQYPMEVEAYWRLGRLLEGEERLDDALEVARQGLAVDPEAKNLYNLLGAIYSQLGRHDQAITAHQHYVALSSNMPNAHDSLGTTFQWAGRYEEATEEFKRALTLSPKFEVAVVHLANVYFQEGRYQQALEQYRRYIQIAPSNLERGRGYGCIAHVYSKMGSVERAEQAAKAAQGYEKTSVWYRLEVALDRKDLATAAILQNQVFWEWPYSNRGARLPPRLISYMRGYLNLRFGKSAEAIENFKEALRHRPATWNIDTYEDCLANAYLELGRLDEAIAEYERILKLNPNYPLANYHLGEAYARKGQRDLARAAYARFLKIWEDADQDLPEVIAAKKYRG